MRLPIAALCAAALLAAACGSGGHVEAPAAPSRPAGTEPGIGGSGPDTGGTTPTPRTFDVDALGPPRFVTQDYIDLASIERISRFRSSVGHDYHDDAESCRSMKHYFMPRATLDWGAVAIFSPVAGTIELTREEFAGRQIVIRSTSHPAFTFVLFHVNPAIAVAAGTPLASGQPIGTHIGSVTMSDIAVFVDAPRGRRLVSWFAVMDDSLFARYAARGVATRESAIITRAERDADPLGCTGEAFTAAGALASWIPLS